MYSCGRYQVGFQHFNWARTANSAIIISRGKPERELQHVTGIPLAYPCPRHCHVCALNTLYR